VTREDANGDTTTFTYDELNRLLTTAHPGDENLTFTYDAEGNRLEATGFGFTRTDEFDALNRLTSTTFDYRSFSIENKAHIDTSAGRVLPYRQYLWAGILAG